MFSLNQLPNIPSSLSIYYIVTSIVTILDVVGTN